MNTADVAIRGATVYDGFDVEARRVDIYVTGTRISAVTDQRLPAKTVINANGLMAAPGFIDAHSHADVVGLAERPSPYKLLQGVTTEIVGNCGMSFAPTTAATSDYINDAWADLSGGVHVPPADLRQLAALLRRQGLASNVAPLIGHSTLRLNANSHEAELRPDALGAMQAELAQAMRQGAWGLSTGLIYAPGCHAQVEELTALARTAAVHGGIYATHIRDEADNSATAIDEAIQIAATAGARLQLSHCKIMGSANHGQAQRLLDQIAAARRSGVDVRGDQYPYTAGATFLIALLPTECSTLGSRLADALRDPSYRALLRERSQRPGPGNGLWSATTAAGVTVAKHDDAAVVGKTLAQLSVTDPFDTACDLLADDPAAAMVIDVMNEDDVRRIMTDPLISIGSDGGPPVPGEHPRTFGCFPHLLGRYVRDEATLTWGEAVSKMTASTARHFGLRDRGALVEGAIADIAVFDPSTIGHDPDYQQPDRQPTGMRYVILAGRIVLDDGVFHGATHGDVLLRGVPSPDPP